MQLLSIKKGHCNECITDSTKVGKQYVQCVKICLLPIVTVFLLFIIPVFICAYVLADPDSKSYEGGKK